MTAAQNSVTPPIPVDGQVSAMLVVDIAGFAYPGRDPDIRRHMQDSCYDYLEEACVNSGVAWDKCRCQDQGDGTLVFLPPDTDLHRLVREFPGRLRARLHRYNHSSIEAAQMRLRVAMHVGRVYPNRHGLSGDDITYLCRMLEAGPLKKAAFDCPTGVAVSVSNELYKLLLQQDPKLADEVRFRPMQSRVKFTRLRTWLHVPGEKP